MLATMFYFLCLPVALGAPILAYPIVLLCLHMSV